MAINYQEILNLVNAGNQMGLSNTIKRDYGIPLDFSSVQESYDAAVIYAATNSKSNPATAKATLVASIIGFIIEASIFLPSMFYFLY
jgi:hypothetical protein